MNSTLRLALALAVSFVAFPLARAQADKPGTPQNGSTAEPSGRLLVPGSDDKAETNKNKKTPETLPAFSATAESGPAVADPLVRVLVTKGILTSEEGRALGIGGTPAEQRDRLAALLRDKGLLSAAEFEAIRTVAPSETRAPVTAATVEKSVAPARSEFATIFSF